ncbi:MAG: DNA replication/repair protein RecF [Gammaproteobacteria bacterium]|jgi:DNA replication and repair protein RecF|nr:DNA replication/repair protein RecF [Gammaproteobacteria bacterium]MBT5222475.1 DNA replication/repair protein RecF [Gammaproteobacteria bacterium]MBT5967458.1 DNA replication/repair protein RecF [Gammaproteobacteria bacterium]MBT6420345.1 DNA replication/repair protein RecF [Gammaproteobacteria bacterium]MBT6576054.1 DNA replication/repair protein RecF [Gammaproteobacteria bacterium]
MALQKLVIYRVRNLEQVSINPAAKINLIYGNNASGKSSVLEAIHLLGRASSFRSTTIKNVIHFAHNDLVISGHVRFSNEHVSTLGIKHDGKNLQIRIDQENRHSRSELAYALPIQLIHPKSYQLLDAGPQLRREFLDWGIFNQHPDFLENWRHFKKALTHRNALLKIRSVKELNVWDHELQQYGTIVANYRKQYLTELSPFFFNIAQQFLTLENLELKLIQGWDDESLLLDKLAEDQEKDLRYGFTHSGPHRADFQLLINSRKVKDFVSRGQLKLLMLSLKLAQVEHLLQTGFTSGCILIDDAVAELDFSSRTKLLEFLTAMNTQVFLTATEQNEFGDLQEIGEYKMFHVEHGVVTEV